MIAKDPDFHALRAAPDKSAFDKFLKDERRRDYPEAGTGAAASSDFGGARLGMYSH